MNNEQIIDRVRQKLVARGIFKGTEIGTQGYLALYQSTQGTFTSIQFDVINNTGTVRSIERRLDNTDMFTITHWALNLVNSASTDAADLAIAQRYTYPNQTTFANSYANLQAIYNGYMSVTVDRTTLIDSFDCYRFYRADYAQAGVNNYTNDSYTSQNYSYAELAPEVTLNGLGSNQLVLNLPASTALGETGTVNGVLLVCRGIRWQNASKVNPS